MHAAAYTVQSAPPAPTHAPRRRVSRRKLAAYIGSVLMLMGLVRGCVLFLESLATVRDERAADAELIGLCKTGAARGSAKMREACLRARADNASPVVLKAMLRSVSVLWRDFLENVRTPFGFSTTLLFVLSALVLPIVPWLKAALNMWSGMGASTSGLVASLGSVSVDEYSDDDVETNARHSVIVLNGARHENGMANSSGGVVTRSTMKRRVAPFLADAPVDAASYAPDENAWSNIAIEYESTH